MPNFVQEYRSTDTPAYANLTGQAGSLIALLDAVLVNGGTTASVTSLTESGTTITAVIASNSTLETGDYLTISGASPAGANGTFQVTVLSGTSFTYVGPGSLGTITGTILYRRASLGWTKAFSGTNLAAYLPQAGTGFPQFYLRVDETGATAGGQKEVAVRGYETMTDVNTGTNLFPTVVQMANGLCWRKSATADATARTWYLIGDGATFYIIMNSDAATTSGRQLNGFGGFTSYKPSDPYNCFLSAAALFNTQVTSSDCGFGYVTAITSGSLINGLYVARPYTGIAGAIKITHISKWSSGGSLGINGSLAAPNAPDGSYWFDSTQIQDSISVLRGRPRGLYTHAHSVSPFASEFDTATGIAGLSGVTLINVLHYAGSAGNVQFDKFGPW